MTTITLSLASRAYPPLSATLSPLPPLTISPHSPLLVCSSLQKPLLLLRQHQQRLLSPAMSSSHLRPQTPATDHHTIQLNDESDFYQIVSPDGRISIAGFGSLLSCTSNAHFNKSPSSNADVVSRAEISARRTFPDLTNFRLEKLNGFRRVFVYTNPLFFERGIAEPETKVASTTYKLFILLLAKDPLLFLSRIDFD